MIADKRMRPTPIARIATTPTFITIGENGDDAVG
jgi:hypothetical protein